MNDVFANTNDYNVSKKRRVLIVFDDMFADILRSTDFKAIVKELFIRYRKLNISIFFITQSYFKRQKTLDKTALTF